MTWDCLTFFTNSRIISWQRGRSSGRLSFGVSITLKIGATAHDIHLEFKKNSLQDTVHRWYRFKRLTLLKSIPSRSTIKSVALISNAVFPCVTFGI